MASGADRLHYSPFQYTTRAAHGLKRSHADMEVSHRSSISPLFEPLEDPRSYNSPPPNRSHLLLPPLVPNIRSPPQAMPPPRHARGFDYRRPVVSGGGQSRGGEVVDLTITDDEEDDEDDADDEEQPAAQMPVRERLPHYDHPIIDLSTDSSPAITRPRVQETPEHRRRTPYLEGRRPPSLVREGSSDVMFMQIRRRQDEGRAREERRRDDGTPSPARRPPNAAQLRVPQSEEPIDLTDDDDIVFVSARRNPNARPTPPLPPDMDDFTESDMEDMLGVSRRPRQRRGQTHEDRINMLLQGDRTSQRGNHGQNHYLVQHIMRAAGTIHQGVAAYLPALPGSNRGHTHTHTHTHTHNFVAPQMNYNAAAFGMGFDPPRPPPAPPYQAPPKPAAGFTRSPTEDEEVVCPHCGDELALGNTDEKRSVWVVKGCGHVYCGQCMLNRFSTNKGRGKGKARDDGAPRPDVKPFKECVVDGCGQRLTKTAVMQLFL